MYFGGGTPSLLEAEQIYSIIETIKSYAELSESCEISMELDPGTFNENKLNELNDFISRFSIGIQTFNKKEFDELGRGHEY